MGPTFIFLLLSILLHSSLSESTHLRQQCKLGVASELPEPAEQQLQGIGTAGCVTGRWCQVAGDGVLACATWTLLLDKPGTWIPLLSPCVFLLVLCFVDLSVLRPFRSASELIGTLNIPAVSNPVANREFQLNRSSTTTSGSSSSRVVVGRHGIRIRPWPHPNPTETMKAHRIIETVQREQRRQFGVNNDCFKLVVEAGGVTNETASIISKSGLNIVHIGFDQRMPNTWDGRHRLEARMRLQALKVVREQKLDGIVMFADDSNMHSMELFDEFQNVKWFGAVSVGILAHSDNADGSSESMIRNKEEGNNPRMPIQGPACNSSNKLVGWHTFNSLPYAGKSATYIDDRAPVLPRKLEWAGFVMNSRLLWGEAEDKPAWVNSLDTIETTDEITGESSILVVGLLYGGATWKMGRFGKTRMESNRKMEVGPTGCVNRDLGYVNITT